MNVRLQMNHIALFGNSFRRGLYGSNGLNFVLFIMVSGLLCCEEMKDDSARTQGRDSGHHWGGSITKGQCMILLGRRIRP